MSIALCKREGSKLLTPDHRGDLTVVHESGDLLVVHEAGHFWGGSGRHRKYAPAQYHIARHRKMAEGDLLNTYHGEAYGWMVLEILKTEPAGRGRKVLTSLVQEVG